MEFISIGPYCSTAEILIEHGLRLNAYPFDYIFSSLELIMHCINDKFNIFLDKNYHTHGILYNFYGKYIEGPCSKSSRHSFYCNFLDTELLKLHHSKYNYNDHYKVSFDYHPDYKVSSGNLFNHHNILDDTVYEKFKRRCDRLLNLINNNSKIVFVYYNCYTNDFNDIIDFYNTFSYNKNIYIVGIFENNYDRKILYENKNCKIYQNYDRSIIFNEIKTVF